MNLLARLTVAAMLALFLCFSAGAREHDQSGGVDTVRIGIDSIGILDSHGRLDGGRVALTVPESTLSRTEGRSPTGALLRSMAFPGWGQFYNRKYIKGIIVMACEGYCIVQAARNWDFAEQAIDLYMNEENDFLRSEYYSLYDFYQDRRNLFLWLSGLAIFISMIDAYVDAHLANFDIDVTPPFEEPWKGAVGLRISYRF